MAWSFNDEPVQLWTPAQPFPERIIKHIQSGQKLYAWNAAFERLMFDYVIANDYGVPAPKLEQWVCLAATARANCLPGNLDGCGRALDSRIKKDHRGAQLIRALSIPQKDGSFNDDPALMQELYEYCIRDVETQRVIRSVLRPLSEQELADYHVSERINDRGVLCDVELCRAAMRYAGDETAELQQEVLELTDGEITTVRSSKLREWVLARLGPEALKMTVRYEDGRKRHSIDKSVRANLLAFAEENPDEVPSLVADVIQCTDDLWASSTAKFKRLSDIADEEDRRVRGAFVFAGGAATGRSSSYGVQVHNLPRKALKNAETARAALVRGHAIVPEFGKRTSDVLRGMLRPSLIPKPGHVFVVADWSAIEGRVNPWLAKSDAGEDKLDVFRAKKDPYIVNAAATFRVDYAEVTPDQRQVGKVQELALGFSGGVGAFASMGRIYGIVVEDSDAQRMVNAWRKANPWSEVWWRQLENAYTRAMRNKGKEFSAGRVTYLYDGQHLWYALPSGRILCYPFARFDEDGSISYLKASWKPAADAKEWPRGRLWRGLACENITQAAANDLLRHTLRVFDDCAVLHVHDEAVLEVPEAEAQAMGAELEHVMTTPPAWAEGLPLAVEWKVLQRYGK
jgi:DNA polymerase